MSNKDDILCSIEVCPAMSKKSGGLTIGAEAHIHDRDDADDASVSNDGGDYTV